MDMKLQSRAETDPSHHVIKVFGAYDLISIFSVLVLNLKHLIVNSHILSYYPQIA